MKFNYIVFLLSICFAFFTKEGQSQNVEKLSTDQFQFTEEPVWDGIDNIYFSDVRANAAYKYSLSMNSFSPAITDTNGGNGLMFNEDEDLIICQGGIKSIVRYSIMSAETEILASTYNDLEFNRPNDLCLDKSGGIYFTDPNFGNTTQTQGTNRLYYREPNGEVIALLDYGADNKPNGVIISGDGKELYIIDTFSTIVKRYDINSDGSISNGIDFATLNVSDPNSTVSGADGMAIDTDGNLYITSSLGIQIFNAIGSLVNTISIPEKATNCTFGGANQDILFVTAGTNFYKVELPGVTGVRHPFDLPEGPLSTNEFTLELGAVKLYPNPLNEKSFSLELEKKHKIETVAITNSLGKLIKKSLYNININEKKIEIVLGTSLQSGVYLVSINTNKGNLQTKLVIE